MSVANRRGKPELESYPYNASRLGATTPIEGLTNQHRWGWVTFVEKMLHAVLRGSIAVLLIFSLRVVSIQETTRRYNMRAQQQMPIAYFCNLKVKNSLL
jgi:hypothetical protein